MGKGNPHRRAAQAKNARAPTTRARTRTRLQKPKLSDPEQNSHDLALQLRALGLYPASTIGDGNCLFRALCDQLHGSPKQHLVLRKEICDWMESHQEHYEGFVEDDRTFEQHLASMRLQGLLFFFVPPLPQLGVRGHATSAHNALARRYLALTIGTYGGHLELSAFAHLKRRNVKVIQPGLVYVIEWNTGPAHDVPPPESTASDGSSSTPPDERSSSPSPTLSAREQRSLRRNKTKEKILEQKRASESKSSSAQASSVEQELGPDGQPLGAVYVAYYDWEHFSSVRNLTGPHQGIPYVQENPPPDGARSTSPSPPPPSSSRKPKGKARESPSSSITNTSVPTTTTDSSSVQSSLLPPTPPDSTSLGDIGVVARSGELEGPKGRSPKRSFDETEDELGSGSEYGRAESKRRGTLHSHLNPSQETTQSEVTEMDQSQSQIEIPLESNGGEDEEDVATEATPPESTTASYSPSPAPDRPASGRTSRRLKKNQPKPKPKRVILLVGQKGKPARSDGSATPEWTANGTGKLDVRGFRELKI